MRTVRRDDKEGGDHFHVVVTVMLTMLVKAHSSHGTSSSNKNDMTSRYRRT